MTLSTAPDRHIHTYAESYCDTRQRDSRAVIVG